MNSQIIDEVKQDKSKTSSRTSASSGSLELLGLDDDYEVSSAHRSAPVPAPGPSIPSRSTLPSGPVDDQNVPANIHDSVHTLQCGSSSQFPHQATLKSDGAPEEGNGKGNDLPVTVPNAAEVNETVQHDLLATLQPERQNLNADRFHNTGTDAFDSSSALPVTESAENLNISNNDIDHEESINKVAIQSLPDQMALTTVFDPTHFESILSNQAPLQTNVLVAPDLGRGGLILPPPPVLRLSSEVLAVQFERKKNAAKVDVGTDEQQSIKTDTDIKTPTDKAVDVTPTAAKVEAEREMKELEETKSNDKREMAEMYEASFGKSTSKEIAQPATTASSPSTIGSSQTPASTASETSTNSRVASSTSSSMTPPSTATPEPPEFNRANLQSSPVGSTETRRSMK